MSEEIRRRHGWLELLQTSGPFLTLPVVHRVFPDGLPPVPVARRAEVRAAVAEMLDTRGATRHALIETVLRDVLDWQQHLRIDTQMPDNLAELVPEHGLSLRPDFGFYAEPDSNPAGDGEADAAGLDDVTEGELGTDEESADEDSDTAEDEDEDEERTGTGSAAGPWRLLGMYLPWGEHPLARVTTGGWAASGVERLAVLLRARQVPVGVVN